MVTVVLQCHQYQLGPMELLGSFGRSMQSLQGLGDDSRKWHLLEVSAALGTT